MYSKVKLDKKVFLWTLFLLQVLLLMLFLSFRDSSDAGGGDGSTASVQFVGRDSSEQQQQQPHQLDTFVGLKTSGIYADEFVGAHNCFRDGIILTNGTTQTGCVCESDYHGEDCGQPEVLWRAFMTAKVPLNISTRSRRVPHNVFYLIRLGGIGGGGIDASLETLEIQVMELMHVVDVFVICDATNNSSSSSSSPSSPPPLKQFAKTGFLKKFSYKIVLLDAADGRDKDDTRKMRRQHTLCSPKYMYRAMRMRLGADAALVNDDDILLMSENDEILNWRAIKYFKWYDHWPQPIRFRLKYTVYGYYWQHPDSTRIGSAGCQLNVLDEQYHGDPARMMAARRPGLIVGDLNHVGGWFCQYCYHPLNIIRKLVAERVDFVRLQADNRIGRAFDAAYVETLIGNGLFVDGKMGLTRLHRFADKYYAPEFVTNSSWNYEGILTNVYATYDDDYAN